MSTVRPQNEKPDWSRYTACRELIRRLMAAFASYRPELHARAGPKWREKHSPAPAD